MFTPLRASDVVGPAALGVVVAVVVGLVVVRDVVDVVGRAEEVDVAGLVAALLEEAVFVRDVAGFLSAAEGPVTLDFRSRVDVVAFTGPLGEVLEVLPASDIRLADPAIPRFSSPEERTDLDFSSAELLTDGRER